MDRAARERAARALIAVGGAAAVAGAAGALAAAVDRTDSAGRWRAPAAADAYRAAYADAMSALPAPTRTLDVPGSFGSVRTYVWEDVLTQGRIPLVLLPTAGHPTPTWAPNLSTLITERPVIAVDPIGDAGLSVQSAAVRSTTDVARWIAEVLSAVADGPAHVVGHGLGAWQATMLALHRPHHVASLTLWEPAFVVAPTTPAVAAQVQPGYLSGAPRALRRLARRRATAGSEATADARIARLVAAGLDDFAPQRPFPVRPNDTDLRLLPMPVLLALGERSVIHDARSTAEHAFQVIPRVRVRLWPGATHALPAERAGGLDRELLTFVSEVEVKG